jgi:hypothetical protein
MVSGMGMVVKPGRLRRPASRLRGLTTIPIPELWAAMVVMPRYAYDEKDFTEQSPLDSAHISCRPAANDQVSGLGPDSDIRDSAGRRNLRSRSHERPIRLMKEQFIHFPVRTNMELHPEALELVDDEGSALVGTEFVSWLGPN